MSMDSLEDILAGRQADEPAESRAIKRYVRDNFKVAVAVQLRERDIIVTAPNAALAGTLRLQLRQLQAAAKTKKRIVLRIG